MFSVSIVWKISSFFYLVFYFLLLFLHLIIVIFCMWLANKQRITTTFHWLFDSNKACNFKEMPIPCVHTHSRSNQLAISFDCTLAWKKTFFFSFFNGWFDLTFFSILFHVNLCNNNKNDRLFMDVKDCISHFKMFENIQEDLDLNA